MTVLVCGAAGFLGRAFVARLSSTKEVVVGLDREAPENAPLASMSRYIMGDALQLDWRQILDDVRPAQLVIALGRASVPQSFEDPDADFREGVLVSQRILEAARNVGDPPCVLVLSSAAVYGNPSVLPVAEDAPLRPISPYGIHKEMLEMLCREYAEMHGLLISVARIFSAYGPGLRRQILWDLLHRLRGPGPVVLRGSGSESRDFLHVRDVAEALALLMQECRLAPAGTLLIRNVGSGQETSIRELGEMILRVMDQPLDRLVFGGETDSGAPSNWRADIGRLEALGFSPSIDLEEGVAQYCRWASLELELNGLPE